MAKTTKIIIGVIIAIIIIGGIWYLVNQKPKEEEVIQIGIIAALTGNAAIYGEMVKNGAVLTADEINEKFGYKKIILLIEDSQSDVATALSAYQRIRAYVQSFIPGQSKIVLALAPLVNSDKIVLLNTSALSPDIRKAGDYVFSNVNDATVEVAAMADFIEKQGLKNIAILYEQEEASIGSKNVFKERFVQSGGTISAEESLEGKAIDVRTQLEKIKKADPDGIYLPCYPENVGLILKQAKQLDLKTKWFSWPAEGPDIINIAGDAADGLIYTSTAFDPNSDDSKIKHFVSNFYSKYNKIPTIYAATSYDGINLLVKAIEETKGDATSIKDYLYKVKNYPGISGLTTFDSDGMVVKDIIFKTIKNGQFVPYEG